MQRLVSATVMLVVLLASGSAGAVELSVWALQGDLGFTPISLAYNTTDGRLLIAGSQIVEWERGATVGTVLVADGVWGGTPFGCAYIPSRDTYMVSDRTAAAIMEVVPGVAGQTPTLYNDVTVANPNYWPAGGMPFDGTYAYYKAQWTGVEQTVRRFTVAGTNGVDSEAVPYAAFQVWSSSGPSQEMTLDSAGTLHLSARNSVVVDNKGIYRWDDTAGALVPIIQRPAIMAHTGESNANIYGMAFDAQDNLYFYDIYSGYILKLDRWGSLTTFLTNDEVRDFMGDPAMSVHPSYMIVVGGDLVFMTGNVSGHILAARLPVVAPDMVTVPGTDYEVSGPTYAYEIGKYEITNAQYCQFLNDAEAVQQVDPADPRCTNMWFEPASGDVYMTDVTIYPQGSEWYNRTLYKTSDFPDSKIKYDPIQAPGFRFYVLPEFDQHPVGTVSWFGAAKFCNWLTVTEGLGAAEICYREGTSRHDWYALTASDWMNQGLLDSERLDLVRNYRGYRLPMDGVNVDNGGPGVAHSWNMDANPYNEWYKAAAFDPAAPDTVRPGPGDFEMVQPDHWTYGFGADTITPADANKGNTGYPPGHPLAETTPVGWYDGVNQLFDSTVTNDTGNYYGLYDMCANMHEWINDTALEAPWDSTYRCARGGKWTNSSDSWVTTSIRVIYTARYYAENSLGFRVARSYGYGDFDGDGDHDAADYAFFADAMAGPADPIPPGLGYEACDYDGNDRVDLGDFSRLQQLLGANP